jgi:hypothetical protein
MPGCTLALRGYWDYDSLIDTRIWPLRDEELYSFLFSFQGKRVRYTIKSFLDCIQHLLIFHSLQEKDKTKQSERERGTKTITTTLP